MMQETLGIVSAGQDLTQQQMAAAVDAIMTGRCSEEQMGLLLTSLHAKGETVEEIAGAASAMRQHMTPIRSSRTDLVDTCGTGGDGSGTFNISTAAAIVTAAAGVAVAKHGNRRITSKTGSADVLAALGVNIEAPVETVERCLDEVGICFCFAPQLHPAMRHVATVRRSLGFPTIFNLLGPLSNPASAPFQLLGVGKPELRQRLSAALALLDARRAVVVCGEDGLDEVTIDGATNVSIVTDGVVSETNWQPSDFGISAGSKESLRVDTPEESAEMIGEVLAGKQGPARDIVVLNAAAAIWTAGRSDSLSACAELAAGAIDDGAASDLLARLAAVSNS